MKRVGSLSDISDGNLYELDDLVTVSCNGCRGKASCCHGMGNSIVLDPYDIYQLTTNLDTTFQDLLIDKVELNIVDGIILPNLKMSEESESCAFLNEQGRCSIHTTRPGVCRLFPLGRYYENGDYKYILQLNECKNSSITKMKVRNWIDSKELDRNKQYLLEWHYFLNAVEQLIKNSMEEQLIKSINMQLLNTFFLRQYDKGVDFYSQFYKCLQELKSMFGLK